MSSTQKTTIKERIKADLMSVYHMMAFTVFFISGICLGAYALANVEANSAGDWRLVVMMVFGFAGSCAYALIVAMTRYHKIAWRSAVDETRRWQEEWRRTVAVRKHLKIVKNRQ
jgi:predicted membrane channel-forming protein YqfA (hemolysin III family)